MKKGYESYDDVKKGTWSDEEDQKLISYIMKYGIWNWNQMPKYAGLARKGKSCRLRWMNYLRPGIKRGPFSLEEVEIVIQMYLSLGYRWSAMAAELPGRTDNQIKNFFHTHLKRRLPPPPSSSSSTANPSRLSRRTINNNNDDDDDDNDDDNILGSFVLESSSSSDRSTSEMDNCEEKEEEDNISFWRRMLKEADEYDGLN